MGAARELGTRTPRSRLAEPRTRLRARLTETLAEHDEGILAAYVEDESRVSVSASSCGARRADEARGRASGLLRIRDHGRGRRAVDGALAELLPASEGDPDGPVAGYGLQDRARCERREDRVRPDVLGHDPDARSIAFRRESRGQGDRDRGLRARTRRPTPVGRPPARWQSSGGSPRSRSATGSARSRRRSAGTVSAADARVRRRRARSATSADGSTTPRRNSPSRIR